MKPIFIRTMSTLTLLTLTSWALATPPPCGKPGFWEGEFLGSGALDPDDTNVVYISNNIDPRDGTRDHEMNEIWKGVTCDDATSFVWTPVTMNSEVDNLRPTVPVWNMQNTALLWFRGDYQTTVDYKAEVVGVLTRNE